METLKPRVLLDGLVFPEGPRWRDGKLYFSDMFSNRVMSVDLQGQAEVLLAVEGDRPSGIGFLPDGEMVVVSMERRQLLRLKPGGPVLHADVKDAPSDGINDMVMDAGGRAYVGSRVGPVQSPTPNGSIILVHPDGGAKIAASDIAFPNGSVITPDGKTFIVAETRGARLTAFDIAEDGSLSNRRQFAEVDDPDGICLDAEGAVWVASPGHRTFSRVLQGGEVTDRITMPEGKSAVACMLGGEGRRTLFLTTTQTEMSNIGAMARELRETGAIKDPFSRAHGRIEIVEVDVPGAGWP